MKKHLIRYLGSLSSGTVAVMTGETSLSVIDKIVMNAINAIENAPESVVKAFSDDGEHFSFEVVSSVLNEAKNAIMEVC